MKYVPDVWIMQFTTCTYTQRTIGIAGTYTIHTDGSVLTNGHDFWLVERLRNYAKATFSF